MIETFQMAASELLPGLDESDACLMRLVATLRCHEGIHEVHLEPETDERAPRFCIRRNPDVITAAEVALGLVLGGGTANLVDRFPDGRVTDFIDVGLGLHRWPTFNLADVFILTGVGLLLFSAYRQEREAMTDECRPPAP